jgi:hypothetical protein
VVSPTLRPNFCRGKAKRPEQHALENAEPALKRSVIGQIISTHFIEWTREGLSAEVDLGRETM